ncbi:MAG: NAD(P)H-dependent oxidoreductase [Chloroflexi bacterium]|nr:NAD(P)H-dependent oxidoreductase [Chloroflexota bacterium]
MAARSREPVRFLVFSASLREGSLNTHLARLAANVIQKHGGTADLASMSDFDVPSYHQDVQDTEGPPPGAEEFHRRLLVNDAFVISSPEYNASIPGLLKNAIDWVSRYHPQPFNERHALLLSASPSMVGGNRGLWALRMPLEYLGARVFPDMFSLSQAHKAFNQDGDIDDAHLSERFDITISAFMDLVEAARNYPCAKKAWFEFLGERTDEVTNHAE